MDEILSIAGDIPVIEDCACRRCILQKYLCRWFRNARLFFLSSQKVNYNWRRRDDVTNDHTISENLNVLRNHGASLSEEERHVGSKPFFKYTDFKVLDDNEQE